MELYKKHVKTKLPAAASDRPAVDCLCQFDAEPAKNIILATLWPALCFTAAGVCGGQNGGQPILVTYSRVAKMFGHATNICGHACILATFWPR